MREPTPISICAAFSFFSSSASYPLFLALIKHTIHKACVKKKKVTEKRKSFYSKRSKLSYSYTHTDAFNLVFFFLCVGACACFLVDGFLITLPSLRLTSLLASLVFIFPLSCVCQKHSFFFLFNWSAKKSVIGSCPFFYFVFCFSLTHHGL